MLTPGHFVHSWVVSTHHIFFSSMPSTTYVFMSKIIAIKTISMQIILMTKVKFSLKPFPLRGKGLLLVHYVPSMAVCIASMHFILLLLSSLWLLSLLLHNILLFFFCFDNND